MKVVIFAKEPAIRGCQRLDDLSHCLIEAYLLLIIGSVPTNLGRRTRLMPGPDIKSLVKRQVRMERQFVKRSRGRRFVSVRTKNRKAYRYIAHQKLLVRQRSTPCGHTAPSSACVRMLIAAIESDAHDLEQILRTMNRL